MADDEQTPDPTNESSDFDAGYGDESAPQYAADHDSDQTQPRPDSQQNEEVVTPQQMREQMQAFQSGLNGVLTQQRANQADHFQMMKEIQALQAEEAKGLPKPPVPYALPAPPDQDTKNNIAVLGTGLLKWGALLGLAFGLTRRSPVRGAMFKTALGSALGAYYEGDDHRRNREVSAWEKNVQGIKEANKQQLDAYHDTLKNQKTTFQQKMDILKAQASVWRNDRMEDAAISSNIQKVEQTYKDMVRMQHHWEQETRKARDEWYKILGLSGKEGLNYAHWVKDHGGPDPTGKTGEELHKIETDYPVYKMIDEYDKRKTQEKEAQKAKEEMAADERKFQLHAREKKFDMSLKAGEEDQQTEPTQADLDKASGVLKDLMGGSQ